MKKLFKKEVIISFIIGVILASSIAVYAAINASDINYTRAGTNITSVEGALNDLYSKTNNIDNYDNKTYIDTGITIINNRVTLTNG